MQTAIQIAPARAEPRIHRKGADVGVQEDRRTSPRIRTLFRVAHLSTDVGDGLCRVQNISDEGMMLVTGLNVIEGDFVVVALSDGVSVSGEVRWTSGTRIGVRFAQAIDSAELLQTLAEQQRGGRQRPPRLAVNTIGLASSEVGLQVVRVLNISQQGMRLAHDGSLRTGLTVKIVLESGIERRGVVRWSDGSMAGLMLLEPLAYQQLESASSL
jgi:hypothetical protein